jgi:hypothetical protein
MATIDQRTSTNDKRMDMRINLLRTLRPLPLMHNWTFWFDRLIPWGPGLMGRYTPCPEGTGYQDQLVQIAEFNTVPVCIFFVMF